MSSALLALTTAAGLLQLLREEYLEVRVFAQAIQALTRTASLASDFLFFFASEPLAFIVDNPIFGGRSSIFGGSVEPKAALPPLLPCGPKERRVPGLPPS
jgi:hypothetical protein